MVLQVHHLGPANNGDETFVLVGQRVRLVPIEGQAGAVQLETDHYRLSDEVALPPLICWPIPNDRNSNLAHSLPWLLEDYLTRPTAGGHVRASFVRKALTDWGRELFQTLFHTDEGREAYDQKRGIPFHHDCMIEVISHESSVLSWPWEALIDDDGVRLGRSMAVDRRLYSQLPSQTETLPSSDGPLRVLLVSARDGPNDVDYLLIGRLLAQRRSIALTCLRPASLEHLAQVLATTNAPFDVVHFDCHGIWADTTGQGDECNLRAC